MFPKRVEQGFLIDELPDETVVFDRARNKAHCLNRLAACVWRHCDGKTSVADIAAQVKKYTGLEVNEELVWVALKRLDRARLLERPIAWPASRSARRDAVRKMAAASVLVPLVMTVLAPTAAQAASSVNTCDGQVGPDVFCRQFLCPGGLKCRNFAGQDCTCR